MGAEVPHPRPPAGLLPRATRGGRWAMASSFLCLAVRGLRADASAVPAAPCRTGRAGDRGRHVRPRGLGPPSSDNTPGVATSRPCGLRWVESADVEGSPGWFFVQPETLLRWHRDLVRRRWSACQHPACRCLRPEIVLHRRRQGSDRGRSYGRVRLLGPSARRPEGGPPGRRRDEAGSRVARIDWSSYSRISRGRAPPTDGRWCRGPRRAGPASPSIRYHSG